MANQLRFDHPCLVTHACSYMFPNNKEREKIKATQMKQSMRPVKKCSKNETKERRKESLWHFIHKEYKSFKQHWHTSRQCSSIRSCSNFQVYANANASLNLYLKIPHSDRDGKSISNFTVKHLQAIWDMCSRTLFIIYMHVTGLHILFDIAKLY